VETIQQLLESMGTKPEEVAETLRAEHVRGLRDSSSYMNPIVRYVNRSLDLGFKLEIGADGSIIRLYDEKVKELKLPLPIQGFLQCFHRGLYPDLEHQDFTGSP
jgi:hypothetical protein